MSEILHFNTDGSPDAHRPGKDKYLSSRMFETLPFVYGERGKFLVDFYTYFRWMDDIADSPQLPFETRSEFMQRQFQLMDGIRTQGQALPIEEFYQSINFDVVPNGGEVLKQFKVLAGTIEEDVNHYGLIPRTKQQISNYGARVMLPYAEVISLTLNGHEVNSTPKFEEFLADWVYLGALLHFPKDRDEEMIIKVGFTDKEVDEIVAEPEVKGRREKILEIFTPQRFRDEWRETLSSFRRGIASFRELDMPSYQKFLSTAYLKLREPLRLPRLFERLEKEIG